MVDKKLLKNRGLSRPLAKAPTDPFADFSAGEETAVAPKSEAPYIYICGGSCGIAMDSAERFEPRHLNL